MRSLACVKAGSTLGVALVSLWAVCALGAVPPGEMSPSAYPEPQKGCLAPGTSETPCHGGIEPIRAHDSKMAVMIYERGAKLGDPNGCVVCHGGNPAEETDKDKAHTGAPAGAALDVFSTHAGSVWVNEKTCGQAGCHAEWTYAQHRSIMQTEAGKIQGGLWGWGPVSTGYAKKFGNYAVDDPDGPEPVFGTEAYKAYTRKLMEAHPDNFPVKLEQLPETDLTRLKDHPEEAVYTYLRTDCQRCHVGVKGRDKRGDFRGMGCSSCHIPYNNAGLYEGGDKTVKRDEAGHSMVHSIQSTREAKVWVNGRSYSGIPHETCVSCHNRGKRIGVSFQGLMEFPYGSPYTAEGNKQPKLHTKYYQFIKDDVHHRLKSRDGNPEGGLLCQDCHTTTSMHGNGNITGTLLANVEIECADCHGTAQLYPWELPLGWGDEFGNELSGTPRGLAESVPEQSRMGTVYDPEGGYILSARGNPMGNVVRKGDKVVVHSDSGLDFEVPTLKSLALTKKWQNPDMAVAAKIRAKKHTESLECYACHSAWAPQCYGCHVKVDFSGDKSRTDWIKSGSTHFPDGHTAESMRGKEPPRAPGAAFGATSENRSYLRWENPVLGINGEGRVSPVIPGCQQITSVVSPDGEVLINNKIWRTEAGEEGGGAEGQRGLDMAPAAPHTTDRQARPCESCHALPKALGYGTHDGRYMRGYTDGVYVDIMNEKGELMTETAVHQISPVPDLPMDLDQIVTREGTQMQTVGHHWPLDGPLSEDQRVRMERAGACFACHQQIPDGTFAYKVLAAAGSRLGLTPETAREHHKLISRIMLLAANVEVFGGGGLILLLGVLGYRYLGRRKTK